MNKIIEALNKPKINAIGILGAMVISWIIAMSTNLPASSGHGGFIPLIFPPASGIFYIGLYFLSRIFIKKFNWVISIYGIISLLYFAIDFYLTENI